MSILFSKKTGKWVVFLMLAVVLIWIFVMSARPAEQSEALSLQIDRWLCHIFVDGYDELSAAVQEQLAINFDFRVRKVAHFVEYAVLGTVLYLASGFIFSRGEARTAAALSVGIMQAVLDELHQYFVPGRTCGLRDVVLDTCGVFFGIVLAAGWLAARRAIGIHRRREVYD